MRFAHDGKERKQKMKMKKWMAMLVAGALCAGMMAGCGSSSDSTDQSAAQASDKTFDGSIWAMSVPPAFIALADRIKAYADSDAAKPSPFVSESFGGYSYSKGQNAAGAANNSWQAVFADELRKWRRISL